MDIEIYGYYVWSFVVIYLSLFGHGFAEFYACILSVDFDAHFVAHVENLTMLLGYWIYRHFTVGILANFSQNFICALFMRSS